MANAVQWTVDQFWSQLQNLSDAINSVSAQLDADKAQLTALYAKAKAEYDPAGSYDRAMLTPLIHRNSELRLTYLAPVKSKFQEAVNAAASVLKKAGITPPTLTGYPSQLGILPAAVLVPVVAVAAVLVGLEAVNIVKNLTQAQRTNTATIAAAMADQTLTPAQKSAIVKQITDQQKAQNAGFPPLFDPKQFIAPLAIIALIVLGPQLLRAMPVRRASA